jgi:branched-chain amino acid transport system permease protein
VIGTALERWWLRALVGAGLLSALLAGVVVLVDYAGSATDERIAMTFLVNLILVMGLQTFVGNSGVISFAHVSFMAIGAYSAALLTTPAAIKETSIPDAPAFIQNAELAFLPATAIAVVVTMVFALVIGLPIVRLAGAAAAVATLGVLVIMHTVLSNFETLTRGAKAFYGIPDYSDLALGLAFGVVAIVAARLIRESAIGLGVRSSREDELSARASGVNVVQGRLVMWVVGAGITAMAGSLYAHYVLAILPNAFYFSLTFVIVTMVIVGGQSITGAFIGAATLSLLTEFLRRAENGFAVGPVTLEDAPGLTTIVLGLLIIGTMIARPKGIAGRWELDDWLFGRRRRASRGEAVSERREDGVQPRAAPGLGVSAVGDPARDPTGRAP